MSTDSTNRLIFEILRIIDHARLEEDLTYAETLGALDIIKHDLLLENTEENQERPDDESPSHLPA